MRSLLIPMLLVVACCFREARCDDAPRSRTAAANSGLVTAAANPPEVQVVVAATKEFRRNGESSMVLLKDGSILQLYGAQKDTGDWSIGVLREVRSADGGKTWSQPETKITDPERSTFQPSLVRLPDGGIGLTHTSLLPKQGAVKLFRRSNDEGKTWSEPVQISDKTFPYTTGPWDKLYRLSNDRIIALLHGKADASAPGGQFETYVMFSDDSGKTWHRRPLETTLAITDDPYQSPEWGFWEPSVVEYGPGKLLLFARTATGQLWQSRSADFGTTWEPPQPSNIPNPLAPPVLTRVPGQETLVLIQNPDVEMGKSSKRGSVVGGARLRLAIRVSHNGGQTWTEPRAILESKDDGVWFDYPAILWREGELHVCCRRVQFDWRKWSEISLSHFVVPTELLK